MEFQGLVTCYWIILDQVQGPCIAIPLQQRHPGAGVENSLISLILTFFADIDSAELLVFMSGLLQLRVFQPVPQVHRELFAVQYKMGCFSSLQPLTLDMPNIETLIILQEVRKPVKHQPNQIRKDFPDSIVAWNDWGRAARKDCTRLYTCGILWFVLATAP
jgi:hypothetical protein